MERNYSTKKLIKIFLIFLCFNVTGLNSYLSDVEFINLDHYDLVLLKEVYDAKAYASYPVKNFNKLFLLYLNELENQNQRVDILWAIAPWQVAQNVQGRNLSLYSIVSGRYENSQMIHLKPADKSGPILSCFMLFIKELFDSINFLKASDNPDEKVCFDMKYNFIIESLNLDLNSLFGELRGIEGQFEKDVNFLQDHFENLVCLEKTKHSFDKLKEFIKGLKALFNEQESVSIAKALLPDQENFSGRFEIEKKDIDLLDARLKLVCEKLHPVWHLLVDLGYVIEVLKSFANGRKAIVYAGVGHTDKIKSFFIQEPCDTTKSSIPIGDLVSNLFYYNSFLERPSLDTESELEQLQANLYKKRTCTIL